MDLNTLTQSPLTRPREESDIDVIQAIKVLMEKQYYPLVSNWLAEPCVVEAMGKNPEMQRFMCNRSLRVKLGMATVQTSVERFMLDANTTIQEYLANVEKYVIPALVIIAADLH